MALNMPLTPLHPTPRSDIAPNVPSPGRLSPSFAVKSSRWRSVSASSTIRWWAACARIPSPTPTANPQFARYFPSFSPFHSNPYQHPRSHPHALLPNQVSKRLNSDSAKRAAASVPKNKKHMNQHDAYISDDELADY